jgi:hypothetical protein
MMTPPPLPRKYSAPDTTKAALGVVREWLEKNPTPQKSTQFDAVDPAKIATSDKSDFVAGYSEFIEQCKPVIAIRCGITEHKVENVIGSLGQQSYKRSTAIIRDARSSNDTKPEDTPENWMMLMAAEARGVASLISMDTQDSSLQKPSGLTNEAANKAMALTFGRYCEKMRSAPDIKARSQLAREFSYELMQALKEQDV